MAADLTVGDIKTNRLLHLGKDRIVQDAAYLMKQEAISSVIVLEGKTICGIVSDGDIVKKVVCGELNPRTTTLSEVMSSPVHTIESKKTVLDAVRLMRDKRVKKLVVVEGKEVVGILSEHDIIEVLPAILKQSR